MVQQIADRWWPLTRWKAPPQPRGCGGAFVMSSARSWANRATHLLGPARGHAAKIINGIPGPGLKRPAARSPGRRDNISVAVAFRTTPDGWAWKRALFGDRGRCGHCVITASSG